MTSWSLVNVNKLLVDVTLQTNSLGAYHTLVECHDSFIMVKDLY